MAGSDVSVAQNLPVRSKRGLKNDESFFEVDLVWLEVTQRLADGESLRNICKDDHMPATATMYRWLAKASDKVRDQYAHAMDLRGQNFGEKVTDIADSILSDDSIDPNRARVAVDALKWAAARLSPKRYGDRIQAEVSGELTATLVPIAIKRDQ
jgi:hypothetical protein|tara:strand:- start:256 stop:717 length:462 start_codon:yes stop_codon:yes gene_type:complete